MRVCIVEYMLCGVGFVTTVRLKIIGNEIIKTVGKSQSCMVPKLPIIFKRTRTRAC